MTRDLTPKGMRVTVDAPTLAWAINSAAVFTAEFDREVRARIEADELPWGVPLRVTIGRDRLLIEAEIGEDLGLEEGGVPSPDGSHQPLTMRFAVPAHVTGSPGEDGVFETWTLPADYLAESLQTATNKRAAEQGNIWRNVEDGDITLRLSTVPELMEEYIAERRREDPGFTITEEKFRSHRRASSGGEDVADDVRGSLTMRTERVLVTATDGMRRDFYCPVLGVESRRLRAADLDIQPLEGPGVAFDFKRMLAAGHAAVAGSDGVLLDPANGRVIAETVDGLYVFGHTKETGDGRTFGRPSDLALARASERTPEEVRRHIEEAGAALLAPALGETLDLAAVVEVLTEDAERLDLDRVSQDMTDLAGRLLSDGERDVAADIRARTAESVGDMESARARIRAVGAEAMAAVDADPGLVGVLRRDLVRLVGRALAEYEAGQSAGLTEPVRTAAASGQAAVISPRMMFASAFTALQSEQRLPAAALEESKRRSRMIHAAAAAAACDLSVDLREEMASQIASVAVAKVRKAGGDRVKPIAALMRGVDEVGRAHLSSRMGEWVASEGLADAVNAGVEEMALAHGGDRILATLAMAVQVTDGDTGDRLDRLVSGVVGRAQVESDVRRRLAQHAPEASPGELVVSGYDFATAHMRRVGRRSAFEIDVRRTLDAFDRVLDVPAHPFDRAGVAMATSEDDRAERAPWAAWADGFLERLLQSDIAGENLALIEAVRGSWAKEVQDLAARSPDEARQILGVSDFDASDAWQVDGLGRALTATIRPEAATLDFPNRPDVYLGASFRDESRKVGAMSLDDRRLHTEGRFGVDPSGRTYFAIASPDARWGVSMVDRAAVHRPEEYLERAGVDEAAVAEILDGAADLARFTIPSGDLVRVAARVADMADSRKEQMTACLTVRWSGQGAGLDEPEVGARVIDHTVSAEGYPLDGTSVPTPDSMGGHLRFYVFGDHGREVIDIPILEAYAVEGGKRAGTSEQANAILARSVVSAVIDGVQFQEIAGFAAESATKAVTVGVTDDGSLVFRGGSMRLGVRMGPATMKRIPREYRELVSRLTIDSVYSWEGAKDHSIEEVAGEVAKGHDLGLFDPDPPEIEAFEFSEPDAADQAEREAREIQPADMEDLEEEVDDDLYSESEIERQQDAAGHVRMWGAQELADAELDALRASGASEKELKSRSRRWAKILEKGERFKRYKSTELEVVEGQGNLFYDVTPLPADRPKAKKP